MPKIIDSDSEDHPSSSRTKAKLFGRVRNIHSIFGGGKVADIVLWRNKELSGLILGAATVVWFLFEVVEYNFLTLLCHISITAMLVLFIWCNGASFFKRPAPKIPEFDLSEHYFKEAALAFHDMLSVFMNIARGEDLKQFLLAIASIWMLSVVGSCCSSISLLYFVFLCIQILPFLYEQYEDDVEYLARRGKHTTKKIYKKFDSNILGKMPRAPVKEKKSK